VKKLVTVGTLVAALALAGCAAGQPTSTTAPAAHNLATVGEESITPSDQPTVEYSGATDELTAWVEQAHKEWVDFYFQSPNASSYAIFVATSDGGSMWARNLEWNAPAPGEIVITVKGNGWTEKDLSMVSSYVMGVLGDNDPLLKSVTAVSEDGKTVSMSDRNSEHL